MTPDTVEVYLALGSNMGNRKQNLTEAINYLSQRLQVVTLSSIYDTEPVGNVDQPRFLNMVCRVYTTLEPNALLALAKGIESKMGRAFGKINAPRPIDIDILIYGDLVLNTRELVIPHPRMAKRAFVLVPLAEIAPGQKHPTSGKTIKHLLADLRDAKDIVKCEND
jgi:GTP cyclohydrolase-4